MVETRQQIIDKIYSGKLNILYTDDFDINKLNQLFSDMFFSPNKYTNLSGYIHFRSRKINEQCVFVIDSDDADQVIHVGQLYNKFYNIENETVERIYSGITNIIRNDLDYKKWKQLILYLFPGDLDYMKTPNSHNVINYTLGTNRQHFGLSNDIENKTIETINADELFDIIYNNKTISNIDNIQTLEF